MYDSSFLPLCMSEIFVSQQVPWESDLSPWPMVLACSSFGRYRDVGSKQTNGRALFIFPVNKN